MRNTSENLLDSLLNNIEVDCNPTTDSEPCGRFCTDCLFLIRDRLPPIAVEALTLVNDRLNNKIPVESVAQMLTKCWQYLDENHCHQPFTVPAVSALRAVICVLDAQKNPRQRNIVDYLSFFLMLVNNVEPHLEEEQILLCRHFAKCLPQSPHDS